MSRAGIFVLVALVVAALTFLVVDKDGPTSASLDPRGVVTGSPDDAAESPTVEESPTDESLDAPAGFDSYRNRAGYSFAYPHAWNLDERGSAVEILAPDASVAMSFGVAPEGDVRVGMGELLDAIEARYEVQEVRGPNDATVGTEDGVSVTGSAVNDDGVDLDFTALVIDAGARNFAVTVFAAENADDSEAQAVLDSFIAF